MASAYQRSNLNKLLFSEADFQNKIGHAQTTICHKRGKHLAKLSGEKMARYSPPDPNNDFIEEVHLGRRFPLCCSNVMLQYDSTTGGWCLYHNLALRKFQLYLDLSWILLDFRALTGRIIRKTPQRTQKNTRTTLIVKAKGGCEFHITRNPGGGLYNCRATLPYS